MKKIENSKKIGISIIGILVMLILAFLILMQKSNADDNAIVYFECKNLKATLNRELGRSPDSDITIKEMHGLTGNYGLLTLGFESITSMKGIEHLINVTQLHLNSNKISKIEGVDSLTNLTELDLSFNQIKKIEGLDKLTNLTRLYLGNNEISKIEGLDKLTKLTYLTLGKQISKIEGLDKLTNLISLDLSFNPISKIEGLDKLTNLTGLVLEDNQISKIEGLDKLTNLTGLVLEDNQISKIEGLNKFTNLTKLNLGNNEISKIEGLDKLTNLTHLDLHRNQISKIEGLDNLTNLTYLGLEENQISKIEALDNFTKLKELDLFSQKIYLDINSSEFELPKVMYKREEVEVSIVDKFKDNITKIGENRYRIDDEGRKKLKERQAIFEWYKEIEEYRSYYNYGPTIFSGEIHAISTSKEKDSFNEEMVKNKCVKVGEKLDITTLLLNKPNGSRVEVVENINTNTLGKKIGKIKVIFSDGSFKEIEVEIIVNTFDVQINYLDKKEKNVKSEVKEVKIDPKKLRQIKKRRKPLFYIFILIFCIII